MYQVDKFRYCLTHKSMQFLGGKVSKMKAIANPNLPVEFPPVDNLDEDLLVNHTDFIHLPETCHSSSRTR